MAKNKSKNKKSEPYTVVFDYKDKDSLYNKPVVLPAAAHWNFDEMLMTYIGAGTAVLLKGPTDWDAHGPKTTKRMKKIQKLSQRFIDHKDDYEYDLDADAKKVFKLINKIGLTLLWD